jgi:hypothetical protein
MNTSAGCLRFRNRGETEMEFGFTNDEQRYREVCAFRDAAVADGWSIEPTYGRHEAVDRFATLRRDGFTMHAKARTKDKDWQKWKYEAEITIWGPDGMVLKPGATAYDWAAIQAAVRTCNLCGATDVDTERYGFAGRCCAGCLPSARSKYERPGWNA